MTGALAAGRRPHGCIRRNYCATATAIGGGASSRHSAPVTIRWVG
ncbi:hypothetical protein KCP69_03600 [Salmonella enterica subsp. enterica]|nr:hypothetical protein KCP69_03600 [Salmonella enterica subsp. enterica]